MDLLIAAIALLVAVYAVVPRARQLDLKLRLGVPDWFVLILGFLGVAYLEFYDFFLARGWVFNKPWPQGITPRNTTYLVMAGVTAFIAIRVRFARLTAGKIQQFRELVEELYWSESYGELMTLLQGHLKQLVQIYNSEFRRARLRNRLESRLRAPRFNAEMIAELLQGVEANDETTIGTLKPKRGSGWLYRSCSSLISGLAGLIVKLLPENDSPEQIARDIYRDVLVSPRFVAALARTRPYLGIDIIRESRACQERHDFIDLYLGELLKDSQSALFAEIRNNQNCSEHRYQISESNRLIHFFLSDAKVANENEIWRPFGEFAISQLDELGRDHETDPYNRAMGDFEKVGAWQSPIFAIIRFFDIMVKEALFQGIKWHMWLYYTPLIVKRMVRNYRVVDPLADPDSEWPIRYSFLLYETFSALRDWVAGVEDVPLNQANATLDSTGAGNENGNIPKSSAIALCQCLFTVLESREIGERLKSTLANMVFNLYFDLRDSSDYEGYAAVLRTLLSRGGQYRQHRQPQRNPPSRDALVNAFEQEKSEFFIKGKSKERIDELEAAVYGRE
jgi:hypothetical protein